MVCVHAHECMRAREPLGISIHFALLLPLRTSGAGVAAGALMLLK